MNTSAAADRPRSLRPAKRSAAALRPEATVATGPAGSLALGETKRLTQVLVATCLVVGVPVALVWTLRAEGVMTSPVLGALVGTGMSLGISRLACWLWEKRTASGDLLFSELMLWGYLRRRHAERQLASAVEMLGPMGRESNSLKTLSAKRRVRLLEQLVASVEHRDPYLHGHSRRVARHAWMIARRMGLTRTEVARIRTAAALHDLGKVNTPTAILHKRAALTDDEFAVIMRHPDEGAEMTAVLQDLVLTSMVRHHHERLDGSGYPGGRHADTIPLGAKIIAVADTFDAITSARPYRAARSHKAAFDVLKAEAGTKLDADVVKTFCAHYTGRRTITLWSFFATLPERLISMLTGAAGSAASAAQTVAVAAVVGATATVSAGAALPSQHRVAPSYAVTRPEAGSATGPQVHAPGRVAASTAPVSRPQRSSLAATAASAAAVRTSRPRLVASAQAGAPASTAGTASSAAGEHAAGHAGVQGKVQATGLGHAEGGESVHPAATAVPAAPRQTSGKTGETPAQGGGEATHGKGAEAPGHHKTEEGPGKSAEAPGHNKAEAPGKSAEAPGHTKTEEAPGRSAEAPGHNKVEAPGKSAESPGQAKTEEGPGKSAEAAGHNKAEEGPGRSAEAHGKG